MFRNSTSRIALASLAFVGSLANAAPALAQSDATERDASAEIPHNDGENVGEEGALIIVTGRAGSDALEKVRASYAISVIPEEDLQMRAPQGVGEALKNVPGFWVENTGGEGSGNLRVRGIPNDGYASVGMLEDGLPLQADAGLGWLNADQSVRLDQSLQRIEVVRGGPSSIFYSNAPGAVVNFITRRGGDEMEGLIRYEVGDYDAHRVDGWVSGPIGGSDWRFFAGGYYRLSDGIRHSGYRQDEGGQARLTLSRTFDGGGSLMLGVKRIDERIGNAQGGIFYTDADGEPAAVPGYDSQHGTIAGPDSRYFDLPTADGTYRFDNANGTNVELTQLTLEADLHLGDTVSIEHRMRYRDSWTRRTAITPYSVADAADLIYATYGGFVPPGASLSLVYRESDEIFDFEGQNGNGLALVNLARTYTVPLEEFVTDTRFVASAEALGHHDFAAGIYFARVNEEYGANSAAILTDVKDNAEVLDVYLVDPAGNRLFQFTDNGVLQYGSEFFDSRGSSETLAFYLSDEWELTDALRIDGGARWEQIAIDGEVGGSTTISLDNGTGTNSAIVASGVYTPFAAKFDHMSWTIGANYQVQPAFGLFARYTEAFRLPNISSYISNASAQPETQTMSFLEGGLKFSRPNFNLYVTGFQTIYHSYAISDYREDADGNLQLTTVYGDTDTKGVEVEGFWRPIDWFDIRAMWTYQDARFTDFVFTNSSGETVDYSDNRLIRVPENVVRATPGLNLLGDTMRIEAVISHYGQRYAEVANQISLPAYSQVDLNFRYDATDRLQFNLFVNNLTDELGLSSGNPRRGSIENDEAGDSVYIGNSIFGRTVRAAVAWRF